MLFPDEYRTAGVFLILVTIPTFKALDTIPAVANISTGGAGSTPLPNAMDLKCSVGTNATTFMAVPVAAAMLQG
jgi:hypothetical protein